MVPADDEFAALMQRVIAREKDATELLEKRYGPVILSAVRRRLSQRMRSAFDSGDFSQEVWMTFYANPPSQGSLQSPDQLYGLFTKIARNTVINALRKRNGKRGGRPRELSLERSGAVPAGKVMADQPTPSQILSRSEEWDRLMKDQPPVYRRVLILLREGKSLEEVAADTCLHTRTIRRIVASILSRESP